MLGLIMLQYAYVYNIHSIAIRVPESMYIHIEHAGCAHYSSLISKLRSTAAAFNETFFVPPFSWNKSWGEIIFPLIEHTLIYDETSFHPFFQNELLDGGSL